MTQQDPKQNLVGRSGCVALAVFAVFGFVGAALAFHTNDLSADRIAFGGITLPVVIMVAGGLWSELTGSKPYEHPKVGCMVFIPGAMIGLACWALLMSFGAESQPFWQAFKKLWGVSMFSAVAFYFVVLAGRLRID